MKAMLATPTAGSPAPRRAAPATTPRFASAIGNRAARSAVTATTSLIGSPSPPGLHLQFKLSTGRALGGPRSHPARTHVDGPRGTADIHAAASRGIATGSSTLPFADRIQPLFGRHDISGIRAHIGPEAAASADAMAAGAYATGNHVVLGGLSDLHTVAHEAAHVVQQRGGVQLPSGVGSTGDAYERHAEAVADAVVAGHSAAPLLDALPSGGAPGPAIQRVGGQKFGIKNTNGQIGTEGHEQLKKIYLNYRDEVKTAKEQAIEGFQKSRQMDDEGVQTAYTHELMRAEMTIEGLRHRLEASGFEVVETPSGTEIYNKGKKVQIATIVTGDAAYEQVEAGDDEQAPIFRKHTLEGMSPREYVRVRGRMLRRFAYRGITPPEREAYQEGRALTPINARKPLTGLMGYNFDDKTGVPIERVHNAETQKISDLEWLNRVARTSLKEIPNDRELLAFLQARKGAGRLFSVTNTPRSITSNHGASFGGFGSIQIDLANVPEDYILHSYKHQGFDADEISRTLRAGASGGLRSTTERGNESIVRNREIVISQIPHRAVTELHDSEERKAYEKTFRALYAGTYVARYEEMLLGAGLTEPVREPATIPMPPDHFGSLQAKADFLPAPARQAAEQDIEPLLRYATAYREAYARQYVQGYQAAAQDKWEEENPESNDLPPQIADPQVPPPKLDISPERLVGDRGRQDGNRDGRATGEAAGANHSFNQPIEQPQETTSNKDKKPKKRGKR